MRTNALATLVVTMALGLSLSACQDTKARDENQQLKTEVTALQKENADLRSRVDQLTVARDGLMKDNDALRAENESLKAKHPAAKTSKHKTM
jgi:cell division protein FtsB